MLAVCWKLLLSDLDHPAWIPIKISIFSFTCLKSLTCHLSKAKAKCVGGGSVCVADLKVIKKNLQ